MYHLRLELIIVSSNDDFQFSKTIEACGLNVGRYRQLIELMKVCEYSRSRSFLDLSPGLFANQNQNLFFSETTRLFFTKLCM